MLLLALAAAVPAANAAEAPAGDAESVERLRQSALLLGAEAAGVEADLSCPAMGRLNIYVGARPGSPPPLEVSVSLDGRPLGRRLFTTAETDSLAGGGLHLLGCLNLDSGEHRLLAEFQVRDTIAPPRLQYDAVFDKAPQIADVLIEVDSAAPVAAPKLALSLWQPPREAPIPPGGLRSLYGLRTRQFAGCLAAEGGADPGLRDAQFLADDGDGFRALAALLHLRSRQPLRVATPAFDCGLATVALRDGALQLATEAAQRAQAEHVDPAILVPLRVELALARYRRGELVRAGEELAALRPAVQREQLPQWQEAQARVLLAQGRLDEAAALLQQIGSGADYQSGVREYNLAVALIGSGRAEQGVALLDRLGRREAGSREGLALRDQANLALGYHFLRQRQGVAAIPVLQRVGLQGRCANRALLGLGWAWVAAEGEETERLRHALVYWTELAARDARDPAVQEGMLATGMALLRLGDKAAARGWYERGTAVLESAAQALRRAQQELAGENWLDALLAQSPDAQPPLLPALYSLDDVLAGDAFQQALTDGRELRRSAAALDQAAPRLAALAHRYATLGARAEALRWRMVQLQPELAAALKEQRSRMRALAMDELAAQLAQNLEMTQQSRLALAQIYDRPGGVQPE